MNEYKAGSTSVVDVIFLQDSASTTGAGKTGLVYNTASLTCYYKRSNGTVSVAVTLADITTLGTFVSGGFKAVDGTNMPGLYEFHPPDAAFATGAKEVTFYFNGASGMVARPVKYRILSVDPDDSVRMGMTALPNAAAAASGGLLINGSNTGTVTLAALTVSGTTTLTGGLSVTGAANFSSNITGNLIGTVAGVATGGITTASFATGATLPRVTLADTLTTYTGNTVQTGDSFARIGLTGSGLTSLAQASIWTSTVAAHIDADISSRLAPTVLGRTLDVTATGAAGIDWGNLENPGALDVNLAGTTVGVVAGFQSGAITASSFLADAISAAAVSAAAVTKIQTGLATPTNITAGTITTVTNLTNLPAITTGWLTAAGIAADAITDAKVASDVTIASVTGAVGSVTGAVGSVTGLTNATISAAVEAAILNEGDATALLAAIAAKVEEFLINEGDATATLAAIAAAVRTNLATELGRIDAAITSRGTSTLTQTQVTGGAYSVQSPLCVLGDARVAHLDADISSRTKPADTQAAVTLVTTTTNLTNLPAVTTDWLTAAGVSAAAVTKIQAGLSTYAGADTAGTTTLLSRVTAAVALASQIPANFTAATFSSAGAFSVGALANAPTGGGTAPTVQQITDGVLDELLSAHTVTGSVGAGIAAAGSAGDPWSTPEPGAYASGTYGYKVSHLDTAAVLAYLQAAGTRVVVGSLPPEGGGISELRRGDDYTAASGRPFARSFTGMPDLSGGTCSLEIFPDTKRAYVNGVLTPAVTVAGTITGSAGAYTLSFDLPTTAFEALATYPGSSHLWEMSTTVAGHKITWLAGLLHVL